MTKKKTGVDKDVLVIGIVCLTALEIVALWLGHNGLLLTGVVGIIAAAIGLSMPQIKFK